MCAIVGAVVRSLDSLTKHGEANAIIKHIWEQSVERGRDGRGHINISKERMSGSRSVERATTLTDLNPPKFQMEFADEVVIGNFRAEPTTEYVRDKSEFDQQPYSDGDWSIVHNGTIANDRDLRTGKVPTRIDSAAIVEQLAHTAARGFTGFAVVVQQLKGSFAIIAANKNKPSSLYVAVNYRPLWYIQTPLGVFFASSRDYFPDHTSAPRMLDPYTVAEFSAEGIERSRSLYKDDHSENRALVVCSGGLDSVVSATYAQKRMGMKLHLIHFLYGSRAEGPEVKAVQAVAEALGAEITLFPLPVYQKGDSPLLDPDSKVAGGEEGAEFAHEWVPARNLLLLSVATAFAEARGIDTIVLGNNLEEAGAYPDNEPEFIARFNDMLPFAVGAGKRMEVIMPVGNMMKHEIVALGHRLGAPMHLTWSCYRAGALHCGKCGPCFMRRTAFDINELNEVIEYKENK